MNREKLRLTEDYRSSQRIYSGGTLGQAVLLQQKIDISQRQQNSF